MRAKFRSVYGLSDGVKVSMKDPNGDLVQDDSTPEDMEMEQEDQIDVTVREGEKEGGGRWVRAEMYWCSIMSSGRL